MQQVFIGIFPASHIFVRDEVSDAEGRLTELFNALNSISEQASLLRVGPGSNKILLSALVSSFCFHLLILYFKPLAAVFHIAPLSLYEWLVVLTVSFPILLIDEFIKCCERNAALLDRFWRTRATMQKPAAAANKIN